MPDYDDQLERFLELAHQAALDYRLMLCSSGNFSWQVDDDHVLISTSRSWLADLSEDEVAICRLSDGAVLNERTPSVESRFHLGILRQRDDTRSVLHFQSRYATLLACSNDSDIDYNVIPEIPYYIGPIITLPYIFPGSADLAEAVVPALAEYNLAVLQGHGLVTVAESPQLAIQNAAFFELACELIVKGKGLVEPLGPKAVRELREASAV